MRIEGNAEEVRQVLQAVVRGEDGQFFFYGHGGMGGAGLVALNAMMQKQFPHPDVPVTICGLSVGSVVGAAHCYGLTRELAPLFYGRFCTREFMCDELLAWIKNQVLNIDLLKTTLLQKFQNAQPYHTNNRLLVGLTEYETGRPVLRECDLSNIEETVSLLLASSAMPGACQPITIGGKQYADGAVGHQIPKELLQEPPTGTKTVLIHVPCSEASLRSGRVSLRERLFLGTPWWRQPEILRSWRLAGWNIPKPLCHKITQRNASFLEAIGWVRSQCALPIGHADRKLPPTLIAWGSDELTPYTVESHTIKRAIHHATMDWRQAFASVA